MAFFHFLHKAWLLFNYSPKEQGSWQSYAGMRDGDWWCIEKAPTLWGKDEWLLTGGKVVSSREIAMMLDRGDFGY